MLELFDEPQAARAVVKRQRATQGRRSRARFLEVIRRRSQGSDLFIEGLVIVGLSPSSLSRKLFSTSYKPPLGAATAMPGVSADVRLYPSLTSTFRRKDAPGRKILGGGVPDVV